MGNSLEEILAAGESVLQGLPPKLLRGRTFHEFPDDEVPSCSSCCGPCEWIYFSSAALKKVQGEPVNWCAGCAKANILDDGKRWKVHTRIGLVDHLAVLTRLRSQASGLQLPELGTKLEMGPPVVSTAKLPDIQDPGSNRGSGLDEQQCTGALLDAMPAQPEKMTAARAKLCEKMKTVLSEYFVTGQGDEFTTSGAEVVGLYRKHFKCPSPQWKQVYEVLTSLGYGCKQETVLSVQGTTKQLTRVVCGLKPK